MQVVRKKLRQNSMQTSEHEQKCLRLLNQIGHPNIIRLLGSYTHQDTHYFLFPCMDMDIKVLLERQERFGDFKDDTTFFQALRGLCSALMSTHNLHLKQETHGVNFDGIGYHHDIRPANILVSRSTFILADFGLGNFKPSEQPSQTLWTQTMGDYLAPECMNATYESQDVTRAIDV